MDASYDIAIVGAGIFGITAALELNARQYSVALLDPGPLPHPLAASTDISKMMRIEYGADEEYTALGEKARTIWLRWNEDVNETLYHEDGIMILTRTPMAPGDFAYESYHLLRQRGHDLERLDQTQIAERMPAWNADRYRDGYFNKVGGYVESGRVVAYLLRRAEREGVTLLAGQSVSQLIEDNARVVGVKTAKGERIEADHIVVAAGAWTPQLVPQLASILRPVGLPVFHLKPSDPSRFTPPDFYPFAADTAKTGWYGFPLHPREGVVKIAFHGAGRPVDPVSDERVVTDEQIQAVRDFLADTIYPLANAPITGTRLCLYCDTPDEHFWIASDPARDGLTVTSGGSGHGFKFAPVLGQLTADTVEDKANLYRAKFGWREITEDVEGAEATRYRTAE